jgi:hypothetical protein
VCKVVDGGKKAKDEGDSDIQKEEDEVFSGGRALLPGVKDLKKVKCENSKEGT